MDTATRELIFQKLAQGQLPDESPVDVQCGRCISTCPCSACDQPIRPGEMYLELVDRDQASTYFHVPCGYYTGEMRGQLAAAKP
jgi:hypothetical protein